MKKQLLITAALLAFAATPALAAEKDGMNEMHKMGKHHKFTECVGVELYTVSPKFANKGKQPEDTTKIPDGWTLVGGAGGGGHPTMLVCR